MGGGKDRIAWDDWCMKRGQAILLFHGILSQKRRIREKGIKCK